MFLVSGATMLLVAAATYTAFPRAHVSLPHNGHSPALTTAGLGHMASITCIETAQHVVSTTVFSAINTTSTTVQYSVSEVPRVHASLPHDDYSPAVTDVGLEYTVSNTSFQPAQDVGPTIMSSVASGMTVSSQHVVPTTLLSDASYILVSDSDDSEDSHMDVISDASLDNLGGDWSQSTIEVGYPTSDWLYDLRVGSYRTLSTPGDNNLCAAFAVARSFNSQRPDLPPVTDEEARSIVLGDDFQSRLQDFQFYIPPGVDDNDVENLRPGLSIAEASAATSNLAVDQAALLLLILGERRGVTLQLGYVLQGVGSQILFAESDTETVWIHNNNAIGLGQGGINHFQGIEIGNADEMPPELNGAVSSSPSAFDLLMRREDSLVSSSGSSTKPSRKKNPPSTQPNAPARRSVLDLLVANGKRPNPDTVSPEAMDTSDAASGPPRQSFSKKPKKTPGVLARSDNHWTLWQFLTEQSGEDRTEISLAEVVSTMRGILRPRVTADQLQDALSDPFVSALADILRHVLGTQVGGKNLDLVDHTDSIAWAVAIAPYVPAPVQEMLLSGVAPDPTQLPWQDTEDVGVYWLGLAPLLPGQIWHHYVGSATKYSVDSPGGLRSRQRAREPYHKESKLPGPFNDLRWQRRNDFSDYTGIEANTTTIDDLRWATLLVVPRSVDLTDVRDTTYFRWLSLIAEAAFTSWLGAHKYSGLNACAWKPSSAQHRPGGTVTDGPAADQSAFRGNPYAEWDVPAFDVRIAGGTNTHSCLLEEVRGAWPSGMSRARRIARQMAYYYANRDVINAKNRAYSAAHPEKKQAQQRAYRAANRDKVKADAAAYRASHVEEIKAKGKAYRAAHPEVYKAKYEANRESYITRSRNYYAANREAILAKNHANAEHHRARARAYADANREKINAKSRERMAAKYKANPEKAIASVRAYVAENYEQVMERRRAYRTANRERINELKRASYHANKAKKAAESKDKPTPKGGRKGGD